MLCDCQLPFKLGLLEEFPLHSQSMVEAPIQKALWISFYAFSFVFPSFLFFFLLWGNDMVLQVRTLVLILDNLPFNPILPRVIISSWEIKLAHCAILSPPENGWIILNNNLNWAHCICEYGMGFVEMCWHVPCSNNYWSATGQVAGQALPSNFRKHFQVTLHICVQPQRLLLSQPQSSSFPSQLIEPSPGGWLFCYTSPTGNHSRTSSPIACMIQFLAVLSSDELGLLLLQGHAQDW